MNSLKLAEPIPRFVRWRTVQAVLGDPRGAAIMIRDCFSSAQRRYSAARAVSSAHLGAAVFNIDSVSAHDSGKPPLIAEIALYSLSHTAPTGLFVVGCDQSATYARVPA
jgi:hypothetical protein